MAQDKGSSKSIARQSGRKSGSGVRASVSTSGPGARYSRLSSRVSRITGTKKGQQTGEDGKIIVIDPVTGVDATPKPLLSAAPDETASGHQPSIPAAEDQRGSFTEIGAGGARSSLPSAALLLGDQADDVRPTPDRAPSGALAAGASRRGAAAKPKPTAVVSAIHELYLQDSDLDALVGIQLSETPTIDMFEQIPRVVSVESAEGREVRARNEAYQKLLEGKVGSDKYINNETQTINGLEKSRLAQCDPVQFSNAGSQAQGQDIERELGRVATRTETLEAPNTRMKLVVNTFENVQDTSALGLSGGGSGMSTDGRASRGGGSTMSMSMSMGAHGSMFGSMMAMGKGKGKPKVPQQESRTTVAVSFMPDDSIILSELPGIAEAVRMVECAVAQNKCHSEILSYHDVRAPAALPRLDDGPTPDASVRPGDDASNAELGTAPSMHAEKSELLPQPSELGPPSRMESSLHDVQGSSKRGKGAGEGKPLSRQTSMESDMFSMVGGRAGMGQMKLLWTNACAATEGLNVTSLAFNRAEAGILAAGHGQHQFDSGAEQIVANPSATTDQTADRVDDGGKDEHGGLVALWYPSSHNWPRHIIRTATGVTALDFSRRYPNILAVGLYNGAVAIYDVANRGTSPVMIANHQSGQHTEPVWRLVWVDFGDRGEALVSISTDGRVTRWSTAKGLEHTDLMRLKKVASPLQQASKRATAGQEAFISRRASGMSLDFSTRDPSIYLVATEEGSIHRCSTSYSEQYLESFWGHMGPVYRVQYSPFLQGVFLSASADWTIRLWREGKPEALLTFSSGTVQINDVAWCPSNSTIFAAATAGGSLELWDLAVSTLKPIERFQTGLGSSLTSVQFSPAHPIVVCGGSSGEVSVLRLYEIAASGTPEEQAQRLEDVVTRNVMKARARKGVLDKDAAEKAVEGEK
ncbi:unnamed protein product [Pedinophyceae sp. YPF-701]|nr:unnamed protein product [Pedinophyceae sp. YPF-701]